jgi:hypothetical protein
MQIRRPIAALMTALALFGGGATMTACQAAGDGQSDGTTDSGNPDSGDDPGSEEQGELPDNSNQDSDTEDSGDDSTDPD